MSTRRRVVTGLSADGRPAFISDGPATRMLSWREGEPAAITWIWSGDELPQAPNRGVDTTHDFSSFFPGPGGVRFMIETFPPGLGVEDLANLGGYLERLSAAGIQFDADSLDGTVHASRTVDYAVVLSGHIWLELEDGSAKELGPGDCVVQNGVPHSWRNRREQPCTIAFFLLGAQN